VTLPDQNHPKFRNRYPPVESRRETRVPIGMAMGVADRATAVPWARSQKYLELAQQARAAGNDIAMQHNLQHAGHWYRTAWNDQRIGSVLSAPVIDEILADH
jgi:N-acyl-D-aspartate/D-glutamate deacylase